MCEVKKNEYFFYNKWKITQHNKHHTMSLKSVTRSDSLLKYSIARKTHYLSEKNAYIALWEKILKPFDQKSLKYVVWCNILIEHR